MSENKQTVRLENLSIGYRGKSSVKEVACGINASLFAGELTCLIGPNGVGKSTLMRTVCAFQEKLGGKIFIEGEELSDYQDKELSKKIENSAFYFYLDTLKYLQRGGRIGSVASFLGDALKLKPVITIDENGVLKTVAKMRGNKFGKQKLIDEVARFARDDNIWIAVKNGGNEEEGIMLKHILRSKFPNAKIRNAGQVAPSLAIHTGPGALGVAVFKVSEKD